MRPDVNRIALKICHELLGSAHSFEFDLAGQKVSVSVARREPDGWPVGASDLSESVDGPWPDSVELACKWATGRTSLWVGALVAGGNSRGMVALAVKCGRQLLLWLTMPRYIKELADGEMATFEGNLQIGKHDATSNRVRNQQLQLHAKQSGMPLRGSNVELFSVKLPFEFSAAEAFERTVRLALIKFPAMAGKDLLDAGTFPFEPAAPLGGAEANDAELEEEDDPSLHNAGDAVARRPNRILYGPPGTGKTYALRLLLKEYESTLSSSDWHERLIASRVFDLRWWEVLAIALRELGDSRVADLRDHPLIKAKGLGHPTLRETLWSTLGDHAVVNSSTIKTDRRRSPPLVFDKTDDSVWRLAGDWREECSDLFAEVDALKAATSPAAPIKRYVFVTFHQSYGYEDFVEGLRPKLADSEVSYEIKAGAFKQLCDRARLDPSNRYAVVIDEINRGNIAKIFGELITLIEPDKREGMPNAISVQLPYSGESFAVPANVDIIGTMNTADRSLALLDIALRRRFEFVEIMPDPSVLKGSEINFSGTSIDVVELLKTLNERIEALFDRDHTIGHAYFVEIGKLTDHAARFMELKATFKNRIIPLLQEYFFEDWHKIRLILGDNQKPLGDQFVREIPDEAERLFGESHDLDGSALKPRFAVQESALENPAAYVAIYKR